MQAAQKQLSVIEGSVDSVIYRNSENGYAVLDLAVGSDYVTVVGELGNIDVGEELRLTGEYVEHPKFGTQFRAEICERKMPETSSAILRYLSSGTIKGIGPALAKKIVDRFGDDTLKIIEETPEKLLMISGIGPKSLAKITESFGESREFAAASIELRELGIEMSEAVRIYKIYGSDSVAVVRDNPYILAEDIRGITFQKADNIAARLGFEPVAEGVSGGGLPDAGAGAASGAGTTVV